MQRKLALVVYFEFAFPTNNWKLVFCCIKIYKKEYRKHFRNEKIKAKSWNVKIAMRKMPIAMSLKF